MCVGEFFTGYLEQRCRTYQLLQGEGVFAPTTHFPCITVVLTFQHFLWYYTINTFCVVAGWGGHLNLFCFMTFFFFF